MNEELVLKKTLRIVTELFPDEDIITEASDFRKDLGADSLDFVETVMKIEERFEITIEDEEGEKIKTVKDLTTLIQNKL